MPSEIVQQAIVLIKSGQKDPARKLLIQAIQANRQDEVAWLWLAETLPDETQKIAALEQCLKFNPNSLNVQKGLAHLRERQAARPAIPSRPIAQGRTTPSPGPGFARSPIPQPEEEDDLGELGALGRAAVQQAQVSGYQALSRPIAHGQTPPSPGLDFARSLFPPPGEEDNLGELGALGRAAVQQAQVSGAAAPSRSSEVRKQAARPPGGVRKGKQSKPRFSRVELALLGVIAFLAVGVGAAFLFFALFSPGQEEPATIAAQQAAADTQAAALLAQAGTSPAQAGTSPAQAAITDTPLPIPPTPTPIPSAAAAVTQTPAPTATDTPAPTPTVTLTPLPEGWSGHRQRGFYLILPEGWEAVDVDQEGYDAIINILKSLNTEWADNFLQTYSSSDLQNMFKFWAMDAKPAGTSYASANVTFESSVSSVSQDDLCTMLPATYKQMGITLSDFDCDLEINDLIAARLVAQLSAGGRTVKQVQYVYVDGRDVWALTLSVELAQWAKYLPVFEQIGESFQVNK